MSTWGWIRTVLMIVAAISALFTESPEALAYGEIAAEEVGLGSLVALSVFGLIHSLVFGTCLGVPKWNGRFAGASDVLWTGGWFFVAYASALLFRSIGVVVLFPMGVVLLAFGLASLAATLIVSAILRLLGRSNQS